MRLTPPTSAPWWQRAFHDCVTANDANGQATNGADLGRAAWLLGAHRSTLVTGPESVERGLADLDGLAAACRAGSLDSWRRLLFVDLGLSGNGIDYHDVRNSFIADVLVRRVGIPISLAVIGMEVGRRMGVQLDGIGLPGHFLLAHRHDGTTTYLDAFNGGATVVLDEIEDRFHSMFGADQPFASEYLRPSTHEAILIRMLANLKQNYARSRDFAGLRDVLRLRASLPDVSITEARELARLHHALRDVHAAIDVLDQAEQAWPDAAAVLAQDRDRVASGLN